jgi:hypothetical protein
LYFAQSCSELDLRALLYAFFLRLDSFLIVVFAQGFASMHYLNKLTRFSYYNGIEFETVAHTRYKASLNNVKEDMAIKCRMEIARIVMNNIFHIR